ncbi:serine/arginine repetitive matrix protein 2-like [Rhinatrema bivittatum]|uniref:serine/arginine repetitive matrix protein 2-like n=1 Tax=Rhinatrema bivittatum TaxID=194408 RepID=UPI00112E9C29|nr:serine/arginine repetitive matrix protein 2-like [Rhinatrema bivittatum]
MIAGSNRGRSRRASRGSQALPAKEKETPAAKAERTAGDPKLHRPPKKKRQLRKQWSWQGLPRPDSQARRHGSRGRSRSSQAHPAKEEVTAAKAVDLAQVPKPPQPKKKRRQRRKQKGWPGFPSPTRQIRRGVSNPRGRSSGDSKALRADKEQPKGGAVRPASASRPCQAEKTRRRRRKPQVLQKFPGTTNQRKDAGSQSSRTSRDSKVPPAKAEILPAEEATRPVGVPRPCQSKKKDSHWQRAPRSASQRRRGSTG